MSKVKLFPPDNLDAPGSKVSIIKNVDNNIKFMNENGLFGFYSTDNNQFIDVKIITSIPVIKYTVEKDNEIIVFNVGEYYFKTDTEHSGGKKNRRKRNTNKSRKCKSRECKSRECKSRKCKSRV